MIRNKVMPRNFGRNEVKIVVRLLDIQSQKKKSLDLVFFTTFKNKGGFFSNVCFI